MFCLLFLVSLFSAVSSQGAVRALCTEGDNIYQPGDHFTAADGCNSCTCSESGLSICTMKWCARVAKCSYIMTLVDPGFTYQEGCADCTCGADGEWACEEQACCLYLDREGSTVRAYPGEKFHDGCNKCKCKTNGSGVTKPACTKKVCPKKCFYRNWEGVTGYSSRAQGQTLPVLAECMKHCACNEVDGGAEVDCTMDNGESVPCVMY